MKEARHGARALAAAAAMLALAAATHFLKLPAPGVILCAGVAAIAARWGYAGGGTAGAAAVAASMFFFSEGHGFVDFAPQSLGRLALTAMSAAVIALCVGGLRRRLDVALRRLNEANAALRSGPGDAGEAPVDTLTGIPGRYAIRRNYSRYENRFVHVMMLDLDEYQHLNDTYGHAVGDYVLRRVGEALREAFGAQACYRYGGDEFLVICEELDRAAFPARVLRLRGALGDIALDDKRLPVRFSAGSVYGACARNDDLRRMMHQARRNLDEVKRCGGNDHIDTEYQSETGRNRDCA